MLNIQLVGGEEMAARFRAMPSALHDALLRKITALTLKLESKVKRDKLSGSVLRVRTGNLRASIYSKIFDDQLSVTGVVAQSGDVKYGAIHEFGGTIKHPGGTPYIVTKAQGAQFISKAAAAGLKPTPKVTRPHDIPMPMRSFLRSSLSDMKSEIIAGLNAAATEGTR